MENKRDNKLDVLRVISMIMVIFIHVSNYYGRAFSDITKTSYLFSIIYNVICRVSVPIFFMISGITLLNKEYDPIKNKKRIINRLITLAVLTIIYFFWDKYFMGKNINILKILEEPERSLLWYMYALIAIYISLPFVKCMVKNMQEREDKLFMILFLLTSLLLEIGLFKTYKIPIISGTYYLGYFISGYIIYKYKDKLDYKKYTKYLIPIFLISVTLQTLLTYFNSIEYNKFYNILLAYRKTFTIINSLSFFILIYSNISNKESKIINVLSYASFGVYLFHGIILDLLMKLILYRKINALYGVPMFTIIIFIITFAFIYLIKKIKPFNKYI